MIINDPCLKWQIDTDKLERVAANEYDELKPPVEYVTSWNDRAVARLDKYLTKLGLGVYRLGNAGLIGFVDTTTQHAHDRWLFYTQDARSTSPRWFTVPHEDLAWGTTGIRFYDLLMELEDLLALGKAIKKQEANANLGDGARRVKLLGTSISDLIIDIKPQDGYADTHELLYHWPDWLARHPEMADIPRELVLRMHGFGPLRDKEPQVIAWEAEASVAQRRTPRLYLIP